MGQCLQRGLRAPRAFVLGRDRGYPVFRLYYPNEHCPHTIRKPYPAGTPISVVRKGLIVVANQEVFLTPTQFSEWKLESTLKSSSS